MSACCSPRPLFVSVGNHVKKSPHQVPRLLTFWPQQLLFMFCLSSANKIFTFKTKLNWEITAILLCSLKEHLQAYFLTNEINVYQGIREHATNWISSCCPYPSMVSWYLHSDVLEVSQLSFAASDLVSFCSLYSCHLLMFRGFCFVYLLLVFIMLLFWIYT